MLAASLWFWRSPIFTTPIPSVRMSGQLAVTSTASIQNSHPRLESPCNPSYWKSSLLDRRKYRPVSSICPMHSTLVRFSSATRAPPASSAAWHLIPPDIRSSACFAMDSHTTGSPPPLPRSPSRIFSRLLPPHLVADHHRVRESHQDAGSGEPLAGHGTQMGIGDVGKDAGA